MGCSRSEHSKQALDDAYHPNVQIQIVQSRQISENTTSHDNDTYFSVNEAKEESIGQWEVKFDDR